MIDKGFFYDGMNTMARFEHYFPKYNYKEVIEKYNLTYHFVR